MQFSARIRRSSAVYANWRNRRQVFGELHGVRFHRSGLDYIARDEAQVAAHLPALNEDHRIEVIVMAVASVAVPDEPRPLDEMTLEELESLTSEQQPGETEAEGEEEASDTPQAPRRRGRPPKGGWK